VVSSRLLRRWQAKQARDPLVEVVDQVLRHPVVDHLDSPGGLGGDLDRLKQVSGNAAPGSGAQIDDRKNMSFAVVLR